MTATQVPEYTASVPAPTGECPPCRGTGWLAMAAGLPCEDCSESGRVPKPLADWTLTECSLYLAGLEKLVGGDGVAVRTVPAFPDLRRVCWVCRGDGKLSWGLDRQCLTCNSRKWVPTADTFALLRAMHEQGWNLKLSWPSEDIAKAEFMRVEFGGAHWPKGEAASDDLELAIWRAAVMAVGAGGAEKWVK